MHFGEPFRDRSTRLRTRLRPGLPTSHPQHRIHEGYFRSMRQALRYAYRFGNRETSKHGNRCPTTKILCRSPCRKPSRNFAEIYLETLPKTLAIPQRNSRSLARTNIRALLLPEELEPTLVFRPLFSFYARFRCTEVETCAIRDMDTSLANPH